MRGTAQNEVARLDGFEDTRDCGPSEGDMCFRTVTIDDGDNGGHVAAITVLGTSQAQADRRAERVVDGWNGVHVRFVDRDGREVPPERPGAIELRSAGAGWRWTDRDGNEWGSAGGPVNGEAMPRWVLRRRLQD